MTVRPNGWSRRTGPNHRTYGYAARTTLRKEPRRQTALAEWRCESLRLGGAGDFFGLVLGLLARLADIDTALEEGAVFDRDALRDDVASERAFVADVHAVGSGEIAANLA